MENSKYVRVVGADYISNKIILSYQMNVGDFEFDLQANTKIEEGEILISGPNLYNNLLSGATSRCFVGKPYNIYKIDKIMSYISNRKNKQINYIPPNIHITNNGTELRSSTSIKQRQHLIGPDNSRKQILFFRAKNQLFYKISKFLVGGIFVAFFIGLLFIVEISKLPDNIKGISGIIIIGLCLVANVILGKICKKKYRFQENASDDCHIPVLGADWVSDKIVFQIGKGFKAVGQINEGEEILMGTSLYNKMIPLAISRCIIGKPKNKGNAFLADKKKYVAGTTIEPGEYIVFSYDAKEKVLLFRAPNIFIYYLSILLLLSLILFVVFALCLRLA